MKRVIVLGGYGGFGARLSRRLASDGWEVFVAGRNIDATNALAATIPHARPLVADRDGDLGPLFRLVQPLLLIDAAGPFQDSDNRVARACIAERVHYFDLADARDFVTQIAQLDELARAAGVSIISGASSLPALSGAVVAELGQGMTAVHSISMSISASNRATAGASVASAILSYAGKPVRLWRGRTWCEATGLQMLKRERYEIEGERSLDRLVALADVPDHDILPEIMPGRPATIFRAGPELSFQLVALWALSWPIRWGWIASLSGLGRWLHPLQRLTGRIGSDRSAMKIVLKGVTGDRQVVRSWTMIANNGDGPEIPVMASQLLARKLLGGRLTAGARHAGGSLTLAAFQPLFAQLAIREERYERCYIPLYQRVMGMRFDQLPAPVRAIHDIIGDGGASGVATVVRGNSGLARIIAATVGFPPAGTHQLHVSFAEEDGSETWVRDFGGRRFASRLSQDGTLAVERFGPLRFHFELPSDEAGLEMIMRKWSIFGLRLPLFLAPRSRAREWAEGEDFCFDVPIALPLIGTIVHYRGRLRRL